MKTRVDELLGDRRTWEREGKSTLTRDKMKFAKE